MSTLMESSGDFTGDDPRAALWSPIPTFDEQNGYWYMTYVAYRAAPNTEKQHRINMDGKIWLSRSETPGIEGIGGPYEDLGIILQKDENADLWEGLQGSDSFYPYRLGDIWYSFYGSCDTQSLPIKWWGVGLAMAPTLQGPWTRCTKMNPVLINDIFTENPIVTKIDGLYYAFYDGGNKMGYSISEDGIHWSKGHEIMFERTWEKNVRTPLSCIALGEGLYSVFYTAYDENGFGCVGNMTIKK
ncbi:hypothetical protein [Clostridium sp.]|uniref:hypothetical protein n=2 Tax=Clostridium sp. TaxID=1506 RepID=UPI00261AB422|nr:hypothetical protein [uncultured Clostridium sp.]